MWPAVRLCNCMVQTWCTRFFLLGILIISRYSMTETKGQGISVFGNTISSYTEDPKSSCGGNGERCLYTLIFFSITCLSKVIKTYRNTTAGIVLFIFVHLWNISKCNKNIPHHLFLELWWMILWILHVSRIWPFTLNTYYCLSSKYHIEIQGFEAIFTGHELANVKSNVCCCLRILLVNHGVNLWPLTPSI